MSLHSRPFVHLGNKLNRGCIFRVKTFYVLVIGYTIGGCPPSPNLVSFCCCLDAKQGLEMGLQSKVGSAIRKRRLLAGMF